jgi:ribonuclease BN (tRNA processing enzyme)
MEITILGSGTSTPDLHRNASGLAVRASDMWLLVDIGPGTMRRMCEAAIDNKWIDIILITHFHPDHVSDLVPFLFASNYEFGTVRGEPFHVVGPRGLEQFYETLVATYGDWIVPRGNRLLKKEMNPRGTDVFARKGVTVQSAPSAHSFPSLSYRIDADEVSVTVSGDTDVSTELVELARGTDLLVCESSLPDGMKVPGHLVPSEAGKIAADAGARKLVLTHFYPPCDEVDVVAQAANVYSGEIVMARDLMVIEV